MIAPRPASPWAAPVHPTTGLTRPQLLGTLPDGSGSYARRLRASSGCRCRPRAVADWGGETRISGAPGGRSSRARIAVAFPASVLVLLPIPSVPSIAAGARTPPEVRVNQIGYDLHGPKRAYLMSSTALTGKTFAVVRTDGSVVYSAGIGASSGAWSDTYGSV